MRFTPAARMTAEFVGTAFLLAAVVGSGIMGNIGGNSLLLDSSRLRLSPQEFIERKMRASSCQDRIDVDELALHVDGKFLSAFVRAVKPIAAQSCCGPTCCH